jgi:hypothetical protein
VSDETLRLFEAMLKKARSEGGRADASAERRAYVLARMAEQDAAVEAATAPLRAALSRERSAREEAERENAQHARDWWKMLVAVATLVDTEGDPEALAAEEFDPWEALRQVARALSAYRDEGERLRKVLPRLLTAIEGTWTGDADPDLFDAMDAARAALSVDDGASRSGEGTR